MTENIVEWLCGQISVKISEKRPACVGCTYAADAEHHTMWSSADGGVDFIDQNVPVF